MAAPYEIVVSPYTIYVAPVGTAFPAVNAAEATFATGGPTSWTKLGTSGNKNYTDAGVTVTHGQTISEFTPAGSTTPRKVWRTGETLMVGCTIADVTPALYATILNNLATVTAAAGTGANATPADIHFEMYRGVTVATFAVLVKGASPVNDSLYAQYEVPCAYQGSSPAPTYSKANPAELAVEFHALELTPSVFGTLRVQTA